MPFSAAGLELNSDKKAGRGASGRDDVAAKMVCEMSAVRRTAAPAMMWINAFLMEGAEFTIEFRTP
jgi:hypothetical protein